MSRSAGEPRAAVGPGGGRAPGRVFRWASLASLAVAVAGLAVSTYLGVAHYTDPDVLACTRAETVNCEVVTTSPQSTFLGIPVAVLGVLWFATMALLCLPVAWRSRARGLHLMRLAGTIVGLGFALWLIAAEVLIIGAICLWCTVAHVLAFALFVIAAVTSPALLIPEEEGDDQASYP